MSIAFITPEYVTETSFDGGLSNYVHKISLALLNRDHNIYVLVASNKNQVFQHQGITVIRVNMKSKYLDIYRKVLKGQLYSPALWLMQSWKLNRALKKLHLNTKIDVAQFASYMATGLFAPKNMKVVSKVSSYQPLLEQVYEIEPTPSSKLNNFFELYALKRMHKVYGPSYLIAKIISKKIKSPVDVLESPLPSNIKRDDKIYKESLKGKKYLLFFGSLGVLKGVKDIAKILPDLFSEHSELYFTFIGKDLGYNGQPIINYVRAQITENLDHIIHLNKMEQKYLVPIIENAYAVVLPSRIDNLPNTCTESMALGKIVIGTERASFEQLIDDGVNGYLCNIADSDSLLSSI